jgi:hypothetical protein
VTRRAYSFCFALLLAIPLLFQTEPEFAFLTETPDETLEGAIEFAFAKIRTPKCQRAFATFTSDDPVKMLKNREITFVIPENWGRPEFAAVTTCHPPRIAINRFLLEMLGPQLFGGVLLHELAHVCSCKEFTSGEMTLAATEVTAETVRALCAPELPNNLPRGPRPQSQSESTDGQTPPPL